MSPELQDLISNLIIPGTLGKGRKKKKGQKVQVLVQTSALGRV